MEQLWVAVECWVGACRVGGIDPEVGGFGKRGKRAKGLLLGEIFFKSPEVEGGRPSGGADTPKAFGKDVEALEFGLEGRWWWVL